MSPSKIVIEYCNFGYNGAGDGYSHNVYIGHVDTLVFLGNYSHHASVGHELKSRAEINFILYNRFSDEDSTASRSIDLPNGGLSFLIGNIIEQGPATQNSNIVGYGLEGLTNSSSHVLYAINNTLINNYTTGSFFDIASGTLLFKAYNNILAGPGNFIAGGSITYDTVANLRGPIPSFNFVSPSNYDFNISSSSPGINSGVMAGTGGGGIDLDPTLIYIHPDSTAPRCSNGNPDIGAYEYCSTTGIINIANDKIKLSWISNNYYKAEFTGKIQSHVCIINIEGKEINEIKSEGNCFYLNTSDLKYGTYFISTIVDGEKVNYKFLVQ